MGVALGDRHVVREVDVLDRAQQTDALVERALERLAAGDETGAASALVDHGGGDGLGEVRGAGRCAARVDQRCAAVVAVEQLVTGQVDRMIGRELAVDERARLADLDRVVAAVVLRELLLDDVGFDRDAR